MDRLHESYFRVERYRIDDIAADPDKFLDAVTHRGYGESHVALVIDVRHRLLRKNQIYARMSYCAIFTGLWHDEQPIAGQA